MFSDSMGESLPHLKNFISSRHKPSVPLMCEKSLLLSLKAQPLTFKFKQSNTDICPCVLILVQM